MINNTLLVYRNYNSIYHRFWDSFRKMSTDVRITELDQNLPLWATEKTLEGMADHLRKSFILDKDRNDALGQTFDLIKSNGKITSKYLESINKAVKGSAVSTESLQGSRKKERAAIDLASNKLDELSSTSGLAGMGMSTLSKHTNVLGGAMNLLSGKLTWGVMVVGPAIALIKGMISTIVETIGAFEEFHKVGIVYNEGILTHRENLARLGMSTKDMTEIVQKHARTISLVSIPQIMRLGRTIGNQADQLYQMGLTTKEATKFMSEHFEMQRLMGVFEFQDAQALSRSVMATMQSLTAYTKIMNKSREEIIESQKKMLDRADFHRLIASMEPELAAQVQKSFSNITGALAGALPEQEASRVADLLTDMIASPVTLASKSYQDLVSSGQYELANVLADEAERVKQGRTSTASAFEFVQRLTQAAEQSARTGFQNILALNQDTAELANFVGGSLVMTGREMEARLTKFEEELGMSRFDPRFFEELAKGISEEQKAATGTRDTLNKLVEGWDYLKVQKTFQLLGADEGGLAGNIEKLNTVLGTFHDKLWQIADMKFGSIQDNFNTIALAAGGVAMSMLLLQKAGIALATKVGLPAPTTARGIKPSFRGMGIGLLGGYGAGMAADALGRDTRGGGLAAAGGTAASLAGLGAIAGPIGAAVGGVVGGAIGLYQNREAIFGRGRVTQEGETARRIQRPEEISQADIDKVINMSEEDEVQKLLRSIASTSAEQRDTMRALERLVRTRASGMTGLS